MRFPSYYLTTALFSVPQEVKELQCSKAGVKKLLVYSAGLRIRLALGTF